MGQWQHKCRVSLLESELLPVFPTPRVSILIAIYFSSHLAVSLYLVYCHSALSCYFKAFALNNHNQ